MNTIEINSIAGESYYVSEAFKSLRTNLQFCGADIKCVMVTSCLPNEGKSVISVELAKSLSDLGKKVIVIDADMRKSVMTSRYQIDSGVKGLSQYLTAQATIDEVVYKTQFNNLDMILSGVFPPNPAELLFGERFSALIKEMRNKYDYIIIDTPPLGCVTDAAVISTHCDGSVLVLAAEKVSSRLALSVKQQLEKSDCKLLGAVINHVDQKSHKGKRYSEYKYKDKYYGQRVEAEVPEITAESSDNQPKIESVTSDTSKSSNKQSKDQTSGIPPLMSTKKPYAKRKGQSE